MTDNNPYASPSANLDPSDERPGELLPSPRKLSAGYGWMWLTGGYEYFSRSPAAWIGAVLLMAGTSLISNVIPVIGALIWALINYVIKGGFMLGAEEQSRGMPFKAGHAFAAFQNPGNLMMLSVISTILFVVAFLFSFGSLIASVVGAAGGGDPAVFEEVIAGNLAGLFSKAIMFAILATPIFMAVIFAPALIAIHDVPVVQAMKMSFDGCLKNVVPFLVYFLIILGVFMLFGLITALLGSVLGGLVAVLVIPVALAAGPIGIASTYHAYRTVFTNAG